MIVFFSRVFQILLSVVSIKLCSHILAPEQMGRLALTNSIVALFAFMLINPVGMFMNRRMHAWWRDGQWPSHLRLFALYVLAAAVLAGLSILIAPSFYSGLQMEMGWMLFLICGSIVLTTSNQMLVSSLNIIGFATPFAVLTIVTPMLGLYFAWLLCSALGSRSEYWLSGLLIGQALAIVPAIAVFRQRWISRKGMLAKARGVTHAMVWRLFVYAWPISIAVVLSWSQNQGYRLIIEQLVGLHELGMFAAAYGIAMGIMSAVESLLGSILQPRFYLRLHTLGISSADAWNEYASVALPILALTATTLAAASTEAVHVFLAPAYWGTANLVCWAAAIEFTRTAANTYSLLMHAEMKTRRLIVPSLLGAALTIGFMTVAARRWGLNGIGPALALAGLIYLLNWHLAAHRLSCISVPIWGLTLACAGGLLAFAAVSAIHMSTAGSGTALSIVFAVIALSVIYLFMAALIVWPAIAQRRRVTQLHTSPR